MKTDDTARIVQIEEKMAFIEKSLSDLDDVVKDLNRSMMTVRKKMARLAERVQSVTVEDSGDVE